MCRWLAYSGAPLLLEELLFKPTHSLIDQSLESYASNTTTNGDGFGIGWYAGRKKPGVFKDIQPAWNDANLRDLAAQVQSPVFLAHVRATTGTAIQRSNCHPFRYGEWLFMHNGKIRDFEKIRRDLAFTVAPELYHHMLGTTDSELMFHLALTFGLEEDVVAAVQNMVGLIESVGREHGIDNPMQMTLGISNGTQIYAFRYSSEANSRTLFHSISVDALRQIHPAIDLFSSDARMIVSEPLGDLIDSWVAIPESSVSIVERGEITTRAFHPISP